MDDILIIYNTQITNINNTLDEFNIIQPKIKFTVEKESHNKNNYLDLTISKARNKLNMGIYRGPTTTNLGIHNDSRHPYEHKQSAINFLVLQMQAIIEKNNCM
jgi:DNA mismatch repair ATPase MutL